MMFQTSRAARVDPAHAAQVVGDYVENIGLPRKDEFTEAEVCELLTGLGYAISPRTLTEFVEKSYIAEPGATWDCTAVYCFAAALESRRRWGPTPNRHDAKKSGARLQIEQIMAGGVAEPVTGLDAHTVEDLL